MKGDERRVRWMGRWMGRGGVWESTRKVGKEWEKVERDCKKKKKKALDKWEWVGMDMKGWEEWERVERDWKGRG